MVERNQIPLSRNLLIILYLSHLLLQNNNTTITHYTSKFIHIQNCVGIDEFTGKSIYDIDINDTYFVIHSLVIVTFLRSFLMKWCFEPFASKFCHIHSKKPKLDLLNKVGHLFIIQFHLYLAWYYIGIVLIIII